MTTIVYRYGIHAPHEGADLVWQQMRAAHRYRCALVEIERGRRAAVREVEGEYGVAPALARVAAATLAEAETYAAIAKHRARSRKRDEPEALRAAHKAAAEACREAVTALRAVRDSLRSLCKVCREADASDPCVHASEAARSMRTKLDRIGEAAKGLAKNAYEHSGCYWGQRAIVDEAAADSFASLPLYDAAAAPNDPHFPRWDGSGSVGLQIIGGLTAAAGHACEDSRLRITAPDPRAWHGTMPDGRATCANRRRYGSTGELALRVGSDGRDPMWARWVLDMDRPLPREAIIKQATVHVQQHGPHSEWSVGLTIAVPDGGWAKDAGTPAKTGGAIAVDLGWRVEGDALRVAAWSDEHGTSGVLRLDAATLRLLRSPEQLRQRQDDLFNGARLGLRWWLDGGAGVPGWLHEAVGAMRAWKHPGRLVALWRHWGENRFEGDERAFGLLTAWHWKSRDIWSAETKNRAQALRRRKEVYRCFAASLAQRYDTIVLEKFDLREIARREAVAAKAENEVARSNRQLAAVSELRIALHTAAASRGRTSVELSAADTTRTCPSCGLVEKRDAAASIVLVCECGHAWDQDRDGAALVLLARWRERPGDAKIVAGARKVENRRENAEVKETRWQKARRKGAEKAARMAAARESAGNAAE